MSTSLQRIWLAVAKSAPPHVGSADFDPALTRATSLPAWTTGRASGVGAVPLLSRISKKRAASEVVEGRSKKSKQRTDEDETEEDEDEEEERSDFGEYKVSLAKFSTPFFRV